MRTTAVPAQVTTVEDKIAGNLGLSQLLLLVVPIFFAGGIYVIAPPFYHMAAYKTGAMVALLVCCSMLSLRIKGKIVLFWLLVIGKYQARARYYVFDKRTLAFRAVHVPMSYFVYEQIAETSVSANNQSKRRLSSVQQIELDHIMNNPAANIAFEIRKGVLNVRAREIKTES